MGLKKMGHDASYKPANVNGRTWYRVNIGEFNDASSAKIYRKQLLKSPEIKAALVVKTKALPAQN